MSNRRKLILMGVCIAIIIVIFTVNILRQMNSNKNVINDTPTEVNVINRAEAYRLLSYLNYDKAKREALSFGIAYTDASMSDWYDTYVNAVWKMGLIEKDVKISPKSALTYGYCKELIDKLILENSNFQQVYDNLSFQFDKAEKMMLIPEFLELYARLLNTIPEDGKPVIERSLFVLSREVSEDGKDRIATDLGLFYYKNAIAYEESKEPKEITSDYITSNYLDKSIQVLLCGQEIVLIKSISTQQFVIHNAWIEQGKELEVDTFVSGIHKSFTTEYPLSNDISKVVGDLTIENQKIIQISVKPDTIQGKVLQTGDNFIEIEGYGKVNLDDNYKIYKIYGELSMEQTSSILVGYKTTDFVVSGGKISAALIKESIKAENIRVLIKTTGYKSIYHSKLEFTVSSDFTVSNKDEETSYTAGEVITIAPGDPILSNGRIQIKPSTDSGKIQLLSIERSSGNPKYRGSFEISEGDGGLIVVNELPLEEYLYAVIPSEMPTYYGTEALKVQAVCARSYAYRHLMANSLNQYGAHVDDSVSYQVYNNIAENDDSILAVKDTYGKVIKYNGDVITAYYFSTSCGYTTGSEYVWANGIVTPYLTGKLLSAKGNSENVTTEEKVGIYDDLSVEDNFKTFITDYDYSTYDSDFDWYRWNVTMKVGNIKKNLDNTLLGRYNANPDLILTMVSAAKGDQEAVFESKSVETIGDIVDISVKKRAPSGIITELLIKGTKNTILIKTEYNIRVLLAPVYDIMLRKNNSEVDNLTLLPSAFFSVDCNKENGKLTSITLYGGGYGHGVGMSQNGVKALTDAGMKYEEITAYFYEGTSIGFIYE